MNKIVYLKEWIFGSIDKIFVKVDKGHIRRSKNITNIPNFTRRRGGKVSYAEWAHVIGIFQTLITQNSTGNTKILDVGCGTGLLGISAYNLVQEEGQYIGIDVNIQDIEYCRESFQNGNYSFQHIDVYNATYAASQEVTQIQWNLEDGKIGLVTALSVWTHFNEEDAYYYMSEVSRVLRSGGKAIITFFILDEHYRAFQERRNNLVLHKSDSFDWTFESRVNDSIDWKTTSWVSVPEDAIGITEHGLKNLLKASGLEIEEYYPGTWKGYPGLYFQDILILKKSE